MIISYLGYINFKNIKISAIDLYIIKVELMMEAFKTFCLFAAV